MVYVDPQSASLENSSHSAEVLYTCEHTVILQYFNQQCNIFIHDVECNQTTVYYLYNIYVYFF